MTRQFNPIKLVYIGLYSNIQNDYLRVNRTIQDHTDYTGLYRTKQNNIGLCRTIYDYMRLYRPKPNFIELQL